MMYHFPNVLEEAKPPQTGRKNRTGALLLHDRDVEEARRRKLYLQDMLGKVTVCTAEAQLCWPLPKDNLFQGLIVMHLDRWRETCTRV